MRLIDKWLNNSKESKDKNDNRCRGETERRQKKSKKKEKVSEKDKSKKIDGPLKDLRMKGKELSKKLFWLLKKTDKLPLKLRDKDS